MGLGFINVGSGCVVCMNFGHTLRKCWGLYISSEFETGEWLCVGLSMWLSWWNSMVRVARVSEMVILHAFSASEADDAVTYVNVNTG